MVMCPENVSAASRSDWIMDSDCVHTSTCLRLSLSTQTPAKGATRNVGIWPAKLTVPSSSAEPVSRYTSHDVAMRVIQVPISEMVCPPKKSLKLRCRSARQIRDVPVEAGVSVAGVSVGALGAGASGFRASRPLQDLAASLLNPHRSLFCCYCCDCFCRGKILSQFRGHTVAAA